MNAIIFDIDGTLIESMDFDSILYKRAVKNILGDVFIHSDWNSYVNVTDVGILCEILKDNGYENSNIYKNAIRIEFGKLIEEYLIKNRINSIPGAIDLIKRIKNESNFVLGIATGGWGHTACLKLTAAGFGILGIPMCSSDDSIDRIEIMKKCLSIMGNDFDKICYVGDGEWDIIATQRIGWDFIGVGHRIEGKCKKWIKDFSDEKAFINLYDNSLRNI